MTILSKRELQRLALITEILGAENISVERFFFKIEKPKDSYSQIHPERVPSYHSDKKCQALTREYENYAIPNEIREQGDLSVIKFRKFFHEKIALFHGDRNSFFLEARKAFKLKKILTDEDMLEIRAPNSGVGEIYDFDLSELENRLDKSLAAAEVYKNKDPDHRLAINKYGNLFNPEIEDPDQKKIIKRWVNIKKDIKREYILYTMVKNNPDIDLDGGFLNGLGLNKCSYCHRKVDDFDFMSIIEGDSMK